MIKVAIMGHGTVGSGVYEVFDMNADKIAKTVGEPVEVKYVLDLRDFSSLPYGNKFVTDFSVIENDPEVTVVAEVMGGVGAAYQFTKRCLEAGKSVCTSNKELVAKHGPELLQIAREHNCNYLFEASVGGGIPIIRPLNYSLTAEKIEAVNGILNGTTNYILSKMEKEGADFDTVLKEAQDKGYAERNPEADVEGYDACRKIAILSSLMFGKNVDSEKVPTEGITKITAADFEYANAAEYTIKLLGRSRAIDDDTAEVMVAPFMLPKDHPLAMVYGVFNAVFVTGNMLGDSMYYGRGAGKLPTASAVVADVVDALKNGSKVHDSLFWQPAEPVEGMLTDPAPAAYYVRAAGVAPAVVEAIYGRGRVVDEHFDGCSYLVEQADAKAMAEAARKVETVGGSVKLVLKKLPEEA